VVPDPSAADGATHELPAIEPPPGAADGIRATRRLAHGLDSVVEEYARHGGVPGSAVWRAALITVLRRYADQDDAARPRFAELVARCAAAQDGGDREDRRDGAFEVRLLRSTATLAVTPGPAEVRVEYPAALVDGGYAERLAGHLVTAAAAGLAAPETAIDEIDILPAAEREQLLEAWNPAPSPRPAGLLHDVTAGHEPEQVAIRFRGRELTYGQLERDSNRLAHALHAHGIGHGDIVGLLLDRGFDLPIAELAVMKAGAAWLPLDPQHPPARLAYLLEDAGSALVLTSADLAALAPAETPRWILGEQELPAIETPPKVDVRPTDLAYLLYTSGSTGIPKGVLVPHYCAYAYCHSAVGLLQTGPADRVAQASNPAFDASIFDCFATLLAGATLISARRETIADARAFAELVRTERVTLSFVPPAVLALLDPEDFAGSALRAIVSAGEALPPEQAARWTRPGLKLHNSYGPTETTVIVTDYLCTDEPLNGPTPIGSVLPNHRGYVLDERMRPVPVGVPGDLFISGTGVTHGYHGRPGLTAERFLPDPYAPTPGRRMYATGDLVRRRADGVLEFLGRRDRQVKLRGQRVELGEIEHTLTQHPAVRQCAVQVHEGTVLVAYLAGEPDLESLRAYLAERLPTYMIPTRLITLPALPLTPNGKLDAARLPSSAVEQVPQERNVAPRTGSERWLAEQWRQLIGVERVGVADNFFDLGGDSLHAIRLSARIRDELHLDVPTRTLFADPVLERIAARLDESAPVSGARAIRPVPREGLLVSAHQQEGLWIQHQLDPSSTAYHIALSLRLRGRALDRAAMERAVHQIVERHESLRTRFVDDGGVPRQVVDDPATTRAPLAVVELPADRVDAWVRTEARRPFDLAAGPLLRTLLRRIADDDHVLLLVVHHIVVDGWSLRIVANELSQLYNAQVGGDEADAAVLPSLRIQPADYAAAQREWLLPSATELTDQLGYWRAQLADLPTVDLPTDRPRPPQPTGAGATLDRALPGGLADAVRAYSREHRVSFLAVLQAGLSTVLHRYTGQTDLPIGSIFSGRTRAELEPLVGLLANTLVLRTDVSGDPTFAQLVERCHETILGAGARQDVPFGLVVDALAPPRVTGRNPLFQISLTLQPPDAALANLDWDGTPVEAVDVPVGSSRFDLALAVIDGADGDVELSVEYATELFDTDRVERFVEHFLSALAGGIAAPGGTIHGIDILPAGERHRLLHGWNETTKPLEFTPVLRQIEQSVEQTPDAIAVIDHDDTPSTYRELDTAANRLAHLLLQRGVKPDEPVGIRLHRGIDLITALLAVWKAGATYLPLDPELPPERITTILDNAAPSVVITHTAHSADTGILPGALTLDTERDTLTQQPDTAPRTGQATHPEHSAYLMYTSGSTGTPKGVRVPHRGLHNRLNWMQNTYPLTAEDRVLHKTPYGFDVSAWELFWPLTTGSTLVIAKPGGHRDPEYLHELINRRHVTTAHFVPTMLQSFLDHPATGRSPLRNVFASGEALPAETANRFHQTYPATQLHNLYGPTEASIDVTAHHTQPGQDTIPIGKPIDNTRIYILDERLRPTPTGIPGHLHIAGTPLAHGYHHQAPLTAQTFLPDPHNPTPGSRMYATGDLARRRADGEIEYLGRTDRQIKLRGQRIEPAEIEHTITRHPHVNQTTVQPHGNTLTAYIVPNTQHPQLDQIRAWTANHLPTYMIPTHWIILDELPTTPNGKLDTSRLPDPTRVQAQYVAPRTEAEHWLTDTWGEIIGVDRVGVQDDFFELGGNSLHITQVVARVRDRFDVEISPREVFTSHTVEALARILDEATADAPAAEEPEAALDDEIAELERLLAERDEMTRLLQQKRAAQAKREAARHVRPVPRDGSLVLTHQQEGLWFEHQLDPSSTVYHIAFALRLRGTLDVAALERALHALVVRHESLRTRFIAQNGLPRQVIEPAPDAMRMPVTDLGPDEITQWAAAEIQRPMDLTAGMLLRFPLGRIAPDDHVLVLVVHHIVADGWSARLLAGELTALYAAETGGEPADLPELSVQPADYAVWQRGWLDEGELERQLDYWRKTLADLPTIDFPTDRPRPAHPTGAGDSLWRWLPDELTASARRYAQSRHVSFLALTQAALLVTLSRHTGQTDLPIGSIFSGRTRADTERMVGYFVNAVVLRTDIGDDPTFDELVDRCHETVLNASARQDVPFGLVVETLRPDRTAGRNPLFQINLSLQPPGAALSGLELSGITAEPVEVSGGFARFDLAISVVDSPDGRLELAAEFSTELFDTDRIERLLYHVVAALAGGLAAPGGTIHGIDILPAGERHRLLHGWNETTKPLEFTPVLRQIEQSVEQTPDAIAVIDHDDTPSTYRELDTAANRLAHLLLQRGVKPDEPVGIRLHRGIDLITALLAVWKAGATYLPLDPELPPERITTILDNAAPSVVITHTAHSADTGILPGALTLDTERDTLTQQPDTAPRTGQATHPEHSAYLMYTSGSTGTPKGVRVPHRGLHNRLNWMQNTYPLTAEDRVLHKTPYGFDVSAWELFWPLTTGSTLVIAKPGGHRDPEYLHELINRRHVTTAHFVPTMLQSFLDHPATGRSPLRNVFASGEALPAETANRFHQTYPATQLHNLYGPTEASIDVTAHHTQPGQDTIPIGKPIDNTRIYILDERLRPTPTGIPGHLHIAGTPLAHGYHHQAPLTAQTFLPDPHNPTPGSRMYATGDLARRRADGEIEYLGRTDRQIKLRGQRIEPAEIEHTITRHPHVNQTTVQPHGNTLTAYIVPNTQHPQLDQIRAWTANHLPTYMIPTHWIILDELPTTPNGKLDTSRLPDPPEHHKTTHTEPRTPTEHWLTQTCQNLLHVQGVGIEDDFFELGANSLHTTQLTARIRDELGVEIAPHLVFTTSSLEELAEVLDDAMPLTAPDRIVALPRTGEPSPCTLQQEGIWFEQRLTPGSSVYHLGFGIQLHGRLDVPVLARALHALVVRHEALRTRFVELDGAPRQVVDAPPPQVALPVTDLSAEDVQEWADEVVRRPMELAEGPLFRTELTRIAADEHVLALVVHHIIADGWSMRILADELSASYTAQSADPSVNGSAPAASDWPALPIQPADHAAWQRARFDGPELERQLGYWRTRLADLPTIDLPTDRPRPAKPTGEGVSFTVRLPDELAAAARGYAAAERKSFLALLQAALLTVLHRYTGQTDLPIGSIFSGRTRAELEPLVGCFVNALVLRTDLEGRPTFGELVARCHNVVLEAAAHQDAPFGLVVDALAPQRVAGRNPLFQISLSLLPSTGGEQPPLGPGLATSTLEVATGRARFDLVINVDDGADGELAMTLEYSTELFDADRVSRLVDHLTAALAGGLAAPGTPLDDIDILSAAERELVLNAWNPPAAPPGAAEGRAAAREDGD